jgi:hypothetical protein
VGGVGMGMGLVVMAVLVGVRVVVRVLVAHIAPCSLVVACQGHAVVLTPAGRDAVVRR